MDYLYKDIAKDPEARAYLREVLHSGGVPTTVVNGQVIIGFLPEVLKEALQLK